MGVSPERCLTMKTTSLWRVAAVTVVVGSFLAAGAALAEGGKVMQHNGNSNGSINRSGTGVKAATTIQTGDRTQSRLRDGSCLTTPTATKDKTMSRLRDGSCLTK